VSNEGYGMQHDMHVETAHAFGTLLMLHDATQPPPPTRFSQHEEMLAFINVHMCSIDSHLRVQQSAACACAALAPLTCAALHGCTEDALNASDAFDMRGLRGHVGINLLVWSCPTHTGHSHHPPTAFP
jgi:hypothetical protein